jgi:general secretion pathway protein G
MTHTITPEETPQKLTLAERLEAARRQLAAGHNKGMSLVEVLIVLTIMASIAGVVGVFALGALEESQIKEANIEVGNLSSMVEQYMLKGSPPKLPETLDQLAEGRNPITKKVPQDPWGNDYVYRKTGSRDFELFSVGPDGQEGTEDDVRPDE